MKKIIVIYSTAGLGHKKAAMALVKVLQDRKEKAEVKAIDLVEYASPFYRFLYTHFYVFMMSDGKKIWGLLYRFSNSPFVDYLTRRMREWTDFQNLKSLEKLLEDEAPDAIVTTHFLVPSIARKMKKIKGFNSRIYAVVTDYGPHSFWLSKHIDAYFVGSESTSKEMIKREIASEKLIVTGIPTTEEFGKEFNIESLRETYGAEKDRKTIFLMSGGFGVGPMERILFSLNSCKTPIQVIAVCGHNKDAYDDIESIKPELDYPVVLFGFTDKIAELMSVSDLMITKAGGISVTEALNMRLPMILFASVPGQETWNEDLLISAGAAIKAIKVGDIPVMADKVLSSEEEMENLKKGIDSIRRPDAAKEIVDIVLDQIGG
jgi:processive 1,2-diacylglycerol beta-glucosyltransferase